MTTPVTPTALHGSPQYIKPWSVMSPKTRPHRVWPNTDELAAFLAGDLDLPEQQLVDEPRPGEVFGGRFQITQRLGQGGLSTVYQAIDSDSGEVVSVCVPETIKGWVARRLVGLRNMGAGLIQSGRTPKGTFFNVFRYAMGVSLTTYINRSGGKLPLSKALLIVREAAQDLIDRRIEPAHGDLSRSNLVIYENAQGKIQVRFIDAEIGKLHNAGVVAAKKTSQPTIYGKPDYLSPEHAGGDALIDRGSDVYALGILMMILILDRIPFPKIPDNVGNGFNGEVFKALMKRSVGITFEEEVTSEEVAAGIAGEVGQERAQYIAGQIFDLFERMTAFGQEDRHSFPLVVNDLDLILAHMQPQND